MQYCASGGILRKRVHDWVAMLTAVLTQGFAAALGPGCLHVRRGGQGRLQGSELRGLLPKTCVGKCGLELRVLICAQDGLC